MMIGSIYFDFISISIIVVFFIFVVIGIIKGFFKMLIDLAESILSLIVSLVFARPVGMILYKIISKTDLPVKLSDSLVNANSAFSNVITADNQMESIKNSLETLKVPTFLSTLLGRIGDKVYPITTDLTIAEYVTNIIFIAVCVIISAILMFLLIRIAMIFLKKIFKELDKIKLIGWVNHLVGGAFGAVNGIIVVFIIMLGISFLMLLPSVSQSIANVIKLNEEGTWTLAKYLYELDLIKMVLKLIGLG